MVICKTQQMASAPVAIWARDISTRVWPAMLRHERVTIAMVLGGVGEEGCVGASWGKSAAANEWRPRSSSSSARSENFR